MRVGRGLAGALVVAAVFAAGYLVGRGQRPAGAPVLMNPDSVPGFPRGGLEAHGQEGEPAFADSVELLLADLDRRIAALHGDAGTADAGFEHIYVYYGRCRDGLRRLRLVSEPDTVEAIRRQVVAHYRAAERALRLAEARPGR
ncbi:MAG: hypothetical protein R6X12_09290 [bacterium]